MADKEMLLEVTVRVRVCPEEFRPYPVIANKPPLEIAMRMTEEKMVNDIRWMDGVDDVESVRTKVIAEVDTELMQAAMPILYRPAKCPTCDSPDPARHPAVQFEGEVQVCSNSWHARNDVTDPRD
jgi:hypothetical protein